MKIWKKTTIGIMTLSATSAYPISRIGNEIVSDSLGFSMELPNGYGIVREYPTLAEPFGEFVEVGADAGGKENVMAIASLEHFAAGAFFPSRESFRKFAQSVHSEASVLRIPLSQPCVEGYMHFHGRSIEVILSWGADKGIVIATPRKISNFQAALSMVRSIELTPGACQWP